MLTSSPWMDIGVLIMLLGPLYLRWPILLLPSLGAVIASFVSLDWANAFHQAVVPTIFVTLFGYAAVVLAKGAGAIE